MPIPIPQFRRQTKNGSGGSRTQTSFVRSQLILFQSRKKWGMLYSMATVAGLLCVPGVLIAMGSETNILTFAHIVMPLPLISLLMATGMYILNDLVDADLDRANGKNRPIPSGLVSKRQAWIFIAGTNGAAVLLSIATLNLTSMIIIVPMLAIGIMYSAPKTAFMNRFVVKTLSIAAFYMLCALLGVMSSYGMDLAFSNPAVPVYAMVMLGIMIFISSTLNDLGDIEGDRAAGRHTIPIVLGGNNTIKMMMVLAASMLFTSWALYGVSVNIGIAMTLGTSLFALLVINRLLQMRKRLDDLEMELMRKHHKKLFPLHLVLQLNLAVGTILLL